jgi:hypothetical protein
MTIRSISIVEEADKHKLSLMQICGMKHAFLKRTIHLKEGTAAPILSGFSLDKNTIGQDELIISRNHD